VSARPARRDYGKANGKKRPGVTTVLGNLGWNTRSLMYWAAKIAYSQGLDNRRLMDGRPDLGFDRVRKDSASAGTMAHAMISEALGGEKADVPEDVSPEILANATAAYELFQAWRFAHDCEVLATELALVDEPMGFGGTIDLVGRVDGVVTLLDVKTGSGVHDEVVLQMAAYRHLWDLHKPDLKISACSILHFPQDGSGFNVVPVTMEQLDAATPAFVGLLWIHQNKKRICFPTKKAVRDDAEID